ncbi:hypothetical protein GCM10029978_066270 [Actinoallomurus acanthiterrae]
MAVEVRTDRLAAALHALGFGEAAEQAERIERPGEEQVTGLRLANALYGVAERLLYAAEDAAFDQTDPGDSEADRVIRTTRRYELRAGGLVGAPETTRDVLATLEGRIARTRMTLFDEAAARFDAAATEPDPVFMVADHALGIAWSMCALRTGVQAGRSAMSSAHDDIARITGILDQLPGAAQLPDVIPSF